MDEESASTHFVKRVTEANGGKASLLTGLAKIETAKKVRLRSSTVPDAKYVKPVFLPIWRQGSSCSPRQSLDSPLRSCVSWELKRRAASPRRPLLRDEATYSSPERARHWVRTGVREAALSCKMLNLGETELRLPEEVLDSALPVWTKQSSAPLMRPAPHGGCNTSCIAVLAERLGSVEGGAGCATRRRCFRCCSNCENARRWRCG